MRYCWHAAHIEMSLKMRFGYWVISNQQIKVWFTATEWISREAHVGVTLVELRFAETLDLYLTATVSNWLSDYQSS